MRTNPCEHGSRELSVTVVTVDNNPGSGYPACPLCEAESKIAEMEEQLSSTESYLTEAKDEIRTLQDRITELESDVERLESQQ